MEISFIWTNEEERFYSLQNEWLALWTRTPKAAVYQLPVWQLNWWNRFRAGRLFVLELRAGERLVGLLPFHADELNVLRPLGGRLYDIDGVLLEDESLAAAIPIALKTLEGALPGLSVEFPYIPDTSPLLSMAEPEVWLDARRNLNTCPTLALPPGATALEQVVPDSMARNVRHTLSRAARVGGLTVEAATLATVDAQLTVLFDLHTARWGTKGRPGAFHDPRVRDFHRAVAPELLKLGLLELFVCRLGERVAAAFYGFAVRDTTYYYLSGFDPKENYASPGTLAVGHAIENAIKRGATSFNFLRGEEPYKYKWGAVDRPLWRRRMTA